MKQLLIGAMLLLITGCATTPPAEKEVTRVYLDESNVLHYEGSLDKEANQKLFSLYTKSQTKPTQISIDSTGGDVRLGIEFGHWVHDNQLSVYVKDLCASSCANYIFPAAKQKLLHKNSILLWHGGSLQGNVNELIMKGEDWPIEWRMSEWRFYNKINVNPIINVYGSLRKHPIQWYEYPLALLGLWESSYVGFDYSIEDMKKFGITNIKLLDGVWDWREHHKKKDIIKEQIMRIKVTQKDLSSPFNKAKTKNN